MGAKRVNSYSYRATVNWDPYGCRNSLLGRVTVVLLFVVHRFVDPDILDLFTFIFSFLFWLYSFGRSVSFSLFA